MFWKRRTAPPPPPVVIHLHTCKGCQEKYAIEPWCKEDEKFCGACRFYIRQLGEEKAYTRRMQFFKENPPC